MSNIERTRRARRIVGATVAAGAATALIAAGCTRPGGGWPTPTTQTPSTPPTTDGHGHTEHDHANQTTTTAGHGEHGGGGGTCPPTTPPAGGGGHGDHGGGGGGDGHHVGYDHEPTAEQKQCSAQLLKNTRDAVKAKRLTGRASLIAAGYFSIGDAMTGVEHYVHKGYHMDKKNGQPNELDHNAIEAFAVKGSGDGRIVAAMYVLNNGKGRADIPDVAGKWTMWHDHTLPFASGNPADDGFYKLKFAGGVRRVTAPMLHTWIERNPCGPYAGTDTANMTGGCTPEAETGYFPQ